MAVGDANGLAAGLANGEPTGLACGEPTGVACSPMGVPDSATGDASAGTGVSVGSGGASGGGTNELTAGVGVGTTLDEMSIAALRSSTHRETMLSRYCCSC